MINGLGGGKDAYVEVSIGDNRRFVKARVGIFGVKLGVATEPDGCEGMFVVPNWERAKQRAAFAQQGGRVRDDVFMTADWDLLPSVYMAFRQTFHIQHQYGLDFTAGEKTILQQLQERTLELNLRVLGVGRGIKRTRVMAELNRLSEELITPLKYARKDTKRAARAQFENLTLRDPITHQVNPQADRARLVAGREDLHQRLNEVLRIEPRIIARQQVLLSLIHIAELKLAATQHFLDLLLDSARFESQLNGLPRRVLADRCELFAQSLEVLDFRPYRKMCLLTAADLRHARDLLRKARLSKDDRIRLKKFLTRCQVAIRIKNVQVDIERLIFKLMRDEQRKIASDKVAAKVAMLRKAIKSIDDSMLKRPVVSIALDHLTVPGKEDYLTEIKKALRTTSYYL